MFLLVVQQKYKHTELDSYTIKLQNKNNLMNTTNAKSSF